MAPSCARVAPRVAVEVAVGASGISAMPWPQLSTARHLGTLLQPQLPPIRGKAAARAEFRRLLCWLPGTSGVVDRTISAPGIAMIEWRLTFPIGRGGTTIPIVDRLLVRDGLVVERAAYFDQTPILLAVGARPWLLPGFARYRFGG
jgi:hypothetical protein